LPRIAPSSHVADGAKLADNVEIGPFCSIGPDVELKEGVRLVSHVYVAGVTTVGARTVVYPFASLGTPPQSTHYRGGKTRLIVGSDCDIREGVTINIGTEDAGALTTVGDRCFMMANSHVGHDCHVGSDVTFANGTLLGGHVTLGDHVFLGGNAAVHQFCRVGEGAMLGGVSGITRDVIPFGFAHGCKADLVGLNVVGLRRRKYSRDDIHRIRRVYRMLFTGGDTFAQRFERVAAEFAGDALIGKIVTFIRDGGSRPLMLPAAGSAGAAPADAS
jgi:UDP-N-acetylglucosamine acyltransferase